MPGFGPLSLSEATQRLLAAVEAGYESVMIAVVAHPDPGMVGSRMLVLAHERLGSLGDPGADAAAAKLAEEALTGSGPAEAGLHSVELRAGGEVTVYLEVHRPPSELVIVGAGHVARPLCTLGALLGLQVHVLDDRAEFASRERFPEAEEVRSIDFRKPFHGVALHSWSHVVLVTRGHRFDYECLREALQIEPHPRYLGMIGSRRRVKATFEALLKEGFPREALARVRAPIGLDIGAETPSEIAVCVAAEIVQARTGASGRPLSEVERVLERLTESVEQKRSDGKRGST
jgi:xanthine dehydrogenase accessory factor